MYSSLVKVHNIVMEASTKEDQAYMKTMNKNDVHQVNGTLIQNLYESVLKRKNIDFGDIPDSNGDIEKVKYYESITESLNVLADLHRKNNINEPAVSDVKLTISNLKQFRPQFMTGFRMKHEFMMIMYNSLVMAIIDATSSLVSTYMEFIVSTDPEYSLSHKANKERGSVALTNLRAFNSACENGNTLQSLNYMIDEKKKVAKGFVGMDDVIIGGVVVMGLLSIVPMVRELIYFYYHSRVKFSDYLDMQADFLEMNKAAVSSSPRSPQERKNIVKKQEEIIKKMRKLSDKLAIDHVDTEDVAKKEIKNENALWSLPKIETQIAKNKMDGNGLNII